jgi:hypothetical protein
VLEIYDLKPEFTAAGVRSWSVYVKPGTLVDADRWKLVGCTFDPTGFQAREIERQGYCLRKAHSWPHYNWYIKAP